MKRVGSIKQAFKPNNTLVGKASSNPDNNNESKMSNHGVSSSILGNSDNNASININGIKPDFHLPKSISSFLKKGTSTLGRNKKDKTNQVCMHHSPKYSFMGEFRPWSYRKLFFCYFRIEIWKVENSVTNPV
jgi:hypothetical protein